MGEITTVGGLEMFPTQRKSSGIDQSDDLGACRFCGSPCGYYESTHRGDKHPIGVICTNTSCGVSTPKHYADRASARAAWLRRSPDDQK